VILDESFKFGQYMRRRAFLYAFLHTAVGTDDIAELVRQIVFSAHALTRTVNGDARPDRGWWYGQHGENHPLRTSIVGVEAQELEGVVGEELEDVEGKLRGNDVLAVALTVVLVLFFALVRSRQFEAFLANGIRCVTAAAAMRDLGGLFGVVLDSALLTRAPYLG